MDIKRYIMDQLSSRYEDLNVTEYILKDMNDEKIDASEFYNQTKDMLPDQDRTLIKKEFGINARLGEEILIYDGYVRHNREILRILEKMLSDCESK